MAPYDQRQLFADIVSAQFAVVIVGQNLHYCIFCVYIMRRAWSDFIITDPALLSRGTDAANTQTALQL